MVTMVDSSTIDINHQSTSTRAIQGFWLMTSPLTQPSSRRHDTAAPGTKDGGTSGPESGPLVPDVVRRQGWSASVPGPGDGRKLPSKWVKQGVLKSESLWISLKFLEICGILQFYGFQLFFSVEKLQGNRKNIRSQNIVSFNFPNKAS